MSEGFVNTGVCPNLEMEEDGGGEDILSLRYRILSKWKTSGHLSMCLFYLHYYTMVALGLVLSCHNFILFPHKCRQAAADHNIFSGGPFWGTMTTAPIALHDCFNVALSVSWVHLPLAQDCLTFVLASAPRNVILKLSFINSYLSLICPFFRDVLSRRTYNHLFEMKKDSVYSP